MQVFHLILPYEDELTLTLDRGARGNENEVRRWLNTELTEEELPRVMASAVALYQELHGINKQWTKKSELPTIWDCLDTAIVWERG